MPGKKKRPGRPEIPPKDRKTTTGASLDWYERRALELEADERGITPHTWRRRKLLRGSAPLIEALRAGKVM